MERVRSPIRYLAVGLVVLFPTIALGLFQGGAGEGAAWPKNSAGITQIAVCFRAMGTTSQDAQSNPYKVGYLRDAATGNYSNQYTADEWTAKRELVRHAVESAWAKWANITFTGWGDCPSNIASGIYVDLIRSSASDFGGDSMPRGYHATGDKVWLRMDTADQRLLRSVVIHEFGHALGFHHEMDRPDAKKADGTQICTDGPVEYPSGTYLTPYYDDVSIMNYCGPPNRNGLSAGDIEGAQKLYGTAAAGVWLKALPSLTLYAM